MIKRRTKLYAHQIECVKFHLKTQNSANWSEMGVGKSLITLEVLRLLYNSGAIRYALILAPLSVIETWKDEIKKHTTFTCTCLYGSVQDKVKLLKNKTPIFLCSYDSVPGRAKKTSGILFNALLKKRFDIIVCDEATYIKSYKAKRTHFITQLCDNIKRKLFLSGTPIANRPEDILTIYRALDGGATFGRNYFTARQLYFANHGYAFPDWRLREDKKEEFTRKIFSNSIRILKDEALQLPSKIFTQRYAYLTPKQISLYTPIARELLNELNLESGKVSIANKLVKLAKLSQITSGFLYTDANTEVFNPNPKLNLLADIIEKEVPADAKIIIFVKWSHDICIIHDLLSKIGITHSVVDGKTKDRDRQINDFNTNTQNKILLAQISTSAYGLNLTIANYVIYYSMSFSATEWWQSQDRIHRVGQKKKCVYIQLLMSDTIDTYIFSSLYNKTDIAKSLVNNNAVLRLKQNLEKYAIPTNRTGETS